MKRDMGQLKGNLRRMKAVAGLLAVVLILPYPYAFADDPVEIVQPLSQIVQTFQPIVSVVQPVSVQPVAPVQTVDSVSPLSGSEFFNPTPISAVSTATVPVSASAVTSAPATISPSVSVTTTPTTPATAQVNAATTTSVTSTVTAPVTTGVQVPTTSQEIDPEQSVTGKFLGTMKTVVLRIGSKILTISQAFYKAARDILTGALRVTQVFLKKFLTQLARQANLQPVETDSATQVGKLKTRPVHLATTGESGMLREAGMTTTDSDEVFKYKTAETKTPIGTGGRIELISSMTMYYKSSKTLRRSTSTGSTTPVSTTPVNQPVSVAPVSTSGSVPSVVTSPSVVGTPGVVEAPLASSVPSASAGPVAIPVGGIVTGSLVTAPTATLGAGEIPTVASTPLISTPSINAGEALTPIQSVVVTVPSDVVSNTEVVASLAGASAAVAPTSSPLATVAPTETISSPAIAVSFTPFVPLASAFTPIVSIVPITPIVQLPAVDLSNAIQLPEGGG